MPDDIFAQKVKFLMPKLQQDLKITKEQAAGIIGSLAAETGGFKHFQELTPVGHRGGWGWAQWTGKRRTAFEKKYGKGNRSDEANYGMLVHELQHDPYWSKELSRLKRAKTLSSAARTFTGSARTGRGFLRPGVEHYIESEMWAERALKVIDKKLPNKKITRDISDDIPDTWEEDICAQFEKTLQLIALTRVVEVDEVNTMKLRAVINAAKDVLDWEKIGENNT